MPMAMIRPWSITATRSQSFSASSIRWVVRNTVLPRSLMPRISSQMARRACGSSPVVSSSRKTRSGSWISAKAMKRRCFWPPERFMNQVSRLSARPSCSSSVLGSCVGAGVERSPQLERFENLDPLLELGLLELHPEPVLELAGIAERIEAEHRDPAAVDLADALDALHGGGLAGPVGADQAEDFAFADLERSVADRHGFAVGLAQVGGFDDGLGRHGGRPVASYPNRRSWPSSAQLRAAIRTVSPAGSSCRWRQPAEAQSEHQARSPSDGGGFLQVL